MKAWLAGVLAALFGIHDDNRTKTDERFERYLCCVSGRCFYPGD